jgi:hypothetical protein
MKRLSRWFTLSLISVALLGTASVAQAGVDVSFGVRVPIDNDGDLFFNISSRYFDRPVTVVDTWGRRFSNPDDLAVFLHISTYSRVGPDTLYAYRRQGMSWFDISVRVGVPVETWYVPVTRRPGPPYGKAYGYWDKHRRNPNYRVRLTDRECRDLVAVRMAHEYYGVSPQVAMDWRRDGTRVNQIMTREYKSRHNKNDRSQQDRDHDDDRGGQHGGRGHGNGNGNGNGHDKDGKNRNH